MKPVLVIGYGNPLREDDGLAWRVVDRLEESSSAVEGMRLHQLVPEIAEAVSSARGVVFVDARAGDAPGSVAVTPLGRRDAVAGRWTHWVGPEQILELAHRLYGRAPPAALVTVGAGRLGHGEGLSEAVEQALPEACDRVLALAREWGEEGSCTSSR